MADTYDVAVVGGRVGGATLAALLAQRGLSVLLLDKASFPSDTFSTHVIYGDSFGVWQEIGAWPAIEAVGAVRLTGIDWRRPEPSASIFGEFLPVNGHAYALCLRRLLLDDILVRNAEGTPGVTVATRTDVVEILRDDGRAVGVRYERRGEGSQTGTARADLVVGADGRSIAKGQPGAPERGDRHRRSEREHQHRDPAW